MKCTLSTCRITNLQYISQKVYGFQTVHPLLGMNDGDVSEALSRLTVYKNVIKKDSPLKDVLDDLSDREQLLRVCGILVGIKNGMLANSFQATPLPFSYSVQYLRDRTREPINSAEDTYFLFAHVAAEAYAIQILSSHYTQGFPRLACIDDGCWGRLLTSCLDEQEEYSEMYKSAHDLQQRLGWSKMRSSIDYKVLCNKAIPAVRFKQEVAGFLSFAGVPDVDVGKSLDYLYWLYFEEAVASQYGTASSTPDDDDASQSPDDWYDKVKANVLDMILESAVHAPPPSLRGMAAKLSTLQPLHKFSWDVGRALKASLKSFNKVDFKIETHGVSSAQPPSLQFTRTLRRSI